MAADQFGGELGEIERLREHVEIGLVESVEGEHDHGDALAREAGITQWLNVVGAQQRLRRQSLPRNLLRHFPTIGPAVRGVAENPTQFGDFAAQRSRDDGLLGRGVEHLASAPSVVVHIDAEGTFDRWGRALDDRPPVTGAPTHIEAVLLRPPG